MKTKPDRLKQAQTQLDYCLARMRYHRQQLDEDKRRLKDLREKYKDVLKEGVT